MLRELFTQNPNIVINTDIDGILSGIILCQYCNCRVVGFSNSKETVWLKDDIQSVYAPVYIDMFVPRLDVYCVDQHIVSVNDAHHNKFQNAGTKISPQLDEHRIFVPDDYKFKYPFGAVHYIIAKLEQEGIHVNLPDLCTIVDQEFNIRLGDLLLRADDAMKTTLDSNYMVNAKNWWNWLLNLSNNANPIQKMSDFLYKQTPPKEAVIIKARTKSYFNARFQTLSGDGGFKNIVDDNNNLLKNFIQYINQMSRIMGMNINYPQHYTPHVGTYRICYWSEQWVNEFVNHNTINGESVFSYAFIFSPDGAYKNFSYTVNMR